MPGGKRGSSSPGGSDGPQEGGLSKAMLTDEAKSVRSASRQGPEPAGETRAAEASPPAAKF